MESMKETAVKIAASAKSGMEKTKATVQEKVEKMTTCDPVEKQMAKEKKEERITEAELKKREELASCSPGTRTDSVPGPGKAQSYSTTGEKGRPTGMLEQMSALPGHGTGEPAGQVVEGVVPSHPIGVATGTERASTAHNPRSGYGTNKGYGTGGTYS